MRLTVRFMTFSALPPFRSAARSASSATGPSPQACRTGMAEGGSVAPAGSSTGAAPLCVTWNTLNRSKWDAFIAKTGAPIQQDWAYGEAMGRLGAKVLRGHVTDAAGRGLAIAQFTARNMVFARWADCTRGPVWLTALTDGEKSHIIQSLRTQSPLAQPRVIAFTPNETAHAGLFGQTKLTRVVSGMHTLVVDLSGDVASVRARAKGKWRNRLKAAEKSAAAGDLTVRAVKAKPKTLDWLLDTEKRQQADRGYAGLPPDFVFAFQDASRRTSSVQLWQADIGGEPAAAMVFLRHANMATYHIGWASPPARALNASNLLLWRAIEALHAEGVVALDLGVADTEHSAGLARFKLGAGATARTLAGTYL